jgi:hypothetical protein
MTNKNKLNIRKKGLVMIIILGIILSLNLVFAISSSANVQFFNSFQNPYCYSTATTSSWIEDNFIVDSLDNCKKQNGFPNMYCCPSTGPTYCKEYNSVWSCVEGPQHCSEISDNYNCTNGRFSHLARKDLETDLILSGKSCDSFGDRYGDSCFEYTSCECKWDGECKAVTKEEIYDGNIFHEGSIGLQDNCNSNETPDTGSCSFNFEIIDNCGTKGFLDRTWTGNWVGTGDSPEYCKSGNDRQPCLDIIKLDFFSLRNILIAVVVIVLIYIFIKRKKRR